MRSRRRRWHHPRRRHRLHPRSTIILTIGNTVTTMATSTTWMTPLRNRWRVHTEKIQNRHHLVQNFSSSSLALSEFEVQRLEVLTKWSCMKSFWISLNWSLGWSRYNLWLKLYSLNRAWTNWAGSANGTPRTEVVSSPSSAVNDEELWPDLEPLDLEPAVPPSTKRLAATAASTGDIDLSPNPGKI